jgi:N-acetylglucosaminyldiphosphoundecaprenol N-acetyl-beta-D-mannosaminyltransferase
MAIQHQAALVTPDGMPLVWLGRLAGAVLERTSGSDLMEKVISDSVASGLRHYLYGGKPGIAQLLQKALEQRYPGAQIVGATTPPFRDLTAAELTDLSVTVRDAGADVIWIGLSTPKQEYLMHRLVAVTSATLVGVGAAFDYQSGVIRRAPRWAQRTGFEWLFRLATEPRRLWRRYLVLLPLFILKLSATGFRELLTRSSRHK